MVVLVGCWHMRVIPIVARHAIVVLCVRADPDATHRLQAQEWCWRGCAIMVCMMWAFRARGTVSGVQWFAHEV